VHLSLVDVTGNVGIGAGGTIKNEAPSTINGNVFQSAAGQYSGPGTLTGSITTNAFLLSTNIAGAQKAATDASALVPTQTFSGITSATTITGVAGINVINIHGNINLNNENLTLNGPVSAFFVLNVSGNLSLTGTASLLTSGGVTNSDTLYNFTSSTASWNTHVGDMLDGVFLAATSTFNHQLDGTFNGELISNNITLLSNAVVTQSGPPNVSVPGPLVGTGLPGLMMAFCGILAWRRKQKSAAALAAA
jgi:hypothetical protein